MTQRAVNGVQSFTVSADSLLLTADNCLSAQHELSFHLCYFASYVVFHHSASQLNFRHF